MANNKERKLKIVPKHFSRVWQDVVFPEIRLAGKWLQDLGFTCGNFVVITQSESSITITALPEVKTEPQPIKKPRKTKPVFSPELDAMPGNQLFSALPAEVYREYVAKTKGKKIGKKKVSKERAWENFKKERANTQTLHKPATDKKIIQLQPEVKQVAAPDDQIIRLHPEANQAAGGCNFDTIA